MAGVILLAFHFPPENTSGAARPHRFFKYLPKFGLEAEVICGLPELASEARGVHRVPEAGAAPGTRMRAGVARLIQRFGLPYNEQLPWIPHAVSKGVDLIKRGSIAAIVSTSPPICTHLAALWIKRKTGVRWIADFRDPFDGNPFRTRKWLFHYDAAIERRVLEEADAVILNTSGVDAWWRTKYPQFAHKFRIIWNGFDPERRVEPLPPTKRQTPLLAHLGTIYGGRHPGLLLESLERLKADVFVQLTGPYEAKLDRMEQFVREGRASYNNRMVPGEEADQLMASADYLLLLDLHDREESVQVPGKLFDYMRVERPILAFTSKGSPTESILSRSGVDHATIYRTDEAGQIDAKVREFLKAGPRVTRPNQWFWEQFDGVSQTGQLAEVITGA